MQYIKGDSFRDDGGNYDFNNFSHNIIVNDSPQYNRNKKSPVANTTNLHNDRLTDEKSNIHDSEYQHLQISKRIQLERSVEQHLHNISYIRDELYHIAMENNDYSWCMLCLKEGHLVGNGCPQTYCGLCRQVGHLYYTCTSTITSTDRERERESSSSNSINNRNTTSSNTTTPHKSTHKSAHIEPQSSSQQSSPYHSQINDQEREYITPPPPSYDPEFSRIKKKTNFVKGKRCYVCSKEGHRAQDCHSNLARRCTNNNCLKLVHYSQIKGNKCKYCIDKSGINVKLQKAMAIDNMNGICFICKKIGHLAKDCTSKTNNKPKKIRCYHCHKRGHQAAECRNNPNNQ